MENANLAPGTEGGNHITGAPATLENIRQAAPSLLRNAIDQRIVKIRPMSTPVDQLTRCAQSRRADAMTVEYYSVDTKQTEARTTQGNAGADCQDRGDGRSSFRLHTDADSIFDVSETILVPDVKGYDRTGKEAGPLVLYVIEKNEGIDVIPVNSRVEDDIEGQKYVMPDIPAGSRLIRMGRAACELDVQTAQFQAMPRKSSNNCQIFKMQVEQSTFSKIAGKEAGWNFSDQEEAAIIDMRLGMEKNFLFGQRMMFFDSVKKQNVYFTGGIWNQARRSATLNLAKLTENDLITLCGKAFTGNNGSKRKILLAGTALIEAISKLQTTKVRTADETRVKWGIEFREIVSNFGSLYVVHSEVFDQCGHASDGFIIDPNYLTKYVHVPFQAEKLDLRSSGQRNTDAVVLTEASCLVLRYPAAHIRVIGSGE